MSRSTKLYKKLQIQRKSPRSLLNIYSRKSLLAEKSYYQVQKRTMHGGVTLTMAVIMED